MRTVRLNILTNTCVALPETEKPRTAIHDALEDSLIVGGIALVSSLIAVDGIPTMMMLWSVTLPALLVGMLTYASKRNIEVNK